MARTSQRAWPFRNELLSTKPGANQGSGFKSRPAHQYLCALSAELCQFPSIAHHYFSAQSIRTFVVTPLVTVTGFAAWQIASPPSYWGLCPETVYLPTDTGTENRPSAPTVMPVMCPLDPWRVTCPLRARGITPAGPPTAWSMPVRVPVGPCGPLGDPKLLANRTEATTTTSSRSKIEMTIKDFRRTAHPPLRLHARKRRANPKHRYKTAAPSFQSHVRVAAALASATR